MSKPDVVHSSPGMVVAVGKCVFSRKDYKTAEFPLSAYNEWQRGAYIQDALPMLSDGDREFILSGISPESFEKMFPADEDDGE